MTSPQQYDQLIKLLIIGDQSVGKSCIMTRFCDGTFDKNMTSTIGIDFKIKHITLDNRKLKLQIWDTAGQERFRTITRAYYRGAAGIMIVFDVNNHKSFANVKLWLKSIEDHGNNQVCKIIIGNKCDCDPNDRQIKTSDAQAFADLHGIKYIETSAQTNMNIEKAFLTLAKDVKRVSNNLNESLAVKHAVTLELKQPPQQTTSYCCK